MTQAPVFLTLADVRRVWDRGAHNAFTDLCRFNDQFWLVFRQATDHVSDDGVIIIMVSDDACDWRSMACLSQPQVDLRDPKITVTPANELLVTCAGVMYEQPGHPHQSFLYYSNDGSQWQDPVPVGKLAHWIWRTRFFDSVGYGVAYDTTVESTTLYRLCDADYQPWVDPFVSKDTHGLGYPNEHDLFAIEHNTLGCLLRRDADTASAQLGMARAPYVDWTWRDLGVRIGGPVVLNITAPSGRKLTLCAVRLYDPVRTSLCWLDTDNGKLIEMLTLPSGGDTSYAGLVQEGSRILCSYYSSHEEKTAIYIATVTVDG